MCKSRIDLKLRKRVRDRCSVSRMLASFANQPTDRSVERALGIQNSEFEQELLSLSLVLLTQGKLCTRLGLSRPPSSISISTDAIHVNIVQLVVKCVKL